MSEHLRDPELDRLVHELNRRAELERPGDAQAGDDLADEDGFGVGAGDTPHARVASAVGVGREAEGSAGLFQSQPAGGVRREIAERGAADFSLRLAGATATPAPSAALAADAGEAKPDPTLAAAGRFRVNPHRQRGQLAASVRTLPRDIPTLASLNLP